MAYFNTKKTYDLSKPEERIVYYRGKIIDLIIILETVIETTISTAIDGKSFGRIFKLLNMYEGISLQTKADIMYDMAHTNCLDFLNEHKEFKTLINNLISVRNKAAHYKVRYDYKERNNRTELVLLLEMPTIKKGRTKGKEKNFTTTQASKTIELNDDMIESFEKDIDKALDLISTLNRYLKN